MQYTGITLDKFICDIIECDSITEIIATCSDSIEKGFVFERLLDIITKFGFNEKFVDNRDRYDNLVGNMNKGELVPMLNLNSYLKKEKVISGKSTGASDISIYDKKKEKYIFISCKFFSTNKFNSNSVLEHGIQEIIAAREHNKHIYKKFKIFLAVYDKNKFLSKIDFANTSSEYITKYIKKTHIIDISDLEQYFALFKSDIIKNKKKYPEINYSEIYGSKRDILKLRFHQELICTKIQNLIIENNKSFLIGAKCRSGKTYMVGGLILKEAERKNNANLKFNVLIITPAPSETLPQFTNDLFEKFKDFDKFTIHKLNGKNMKLKNLSENNIFIASKQFLQRHTHDNILKCLSKIKMDMIFFDENHFAGTTDLSKDIINTYTNKSCVKIYLTATFSKPLSEWKIPSESQMYWSLEDEHICKEIFNNEKKIDLLYRQHGKRDVQHIIEKYTKNKLNIKQIFEPYTLMPKLALLTNMFDELKYEKLKEKISDTTYGFSFDTLFSVCKKINSIDLNRFEYPNEVKLFLDYICGSNKEKHYKNGDLSFFTRINKICTRESFIQVWFLPPNNINNISKALIKLMMENPVLSKYDILAINRKNNDLATDIKLTIDRAEDIARFNKKRGLILLSGNMLSLGITIKSCDVVFLMNNAFSADKVMQQMFRSMTEGKDKSHGIVVDLNISRVLNTCINYITNKTDLNVESKFEYIFDHNLIDIDIDLFANKKIKTKDLMKKMLDIWKQNPINNIINLLKNLDNEVIDFDNDTQKQINKLFYSKKDKIKLTIKLDQENDQEIKSGSTRNIIEKEHDIDTSSSDADNNAKKIEADISFTKEVLPYIIPLTCILTIGNNNKDFIQMLNDIAQDKNLLDIFDDQCKIWWNKSSLLDLIKMIVEKYFDKNSNTYNISIQFKLSMENLINYPDKLLELINECLKPKTIEKKTYGEVFTPMSFINDTMLSDLERYWKERYQTNLWEQSDITFFDPAAGMGNFPIAIYYKLFSGLKNKIPNESDRKKHIIQKQLFMSELNKKNCFIINQIFNNDRKLKLNLFVGDSLTIDIKKEFKIDKFDITIGNPPYNELLTKVGAKPLYNKFIEYFLDKSIQMSFVIPSRWFSGGKGLDKFRSMMLNRSDIYSIKHFDDASEIFGNNVDIKGGINVFILDKYHQGPCDYNGHELELNKYDVLIDSQYYDIIDKVIKHESITKNYISQDHYKIQTNDKRLIDKFKNGYVKCYVSKQKGFCKYIKKSELTKKYDNYKIILARAAHEHGSGFGNIFIGTPQEVHCKTYISINVKNKDQAKSLKSYLECRVPNFLLSLRKISQDISESTLKWIPLVPLDRIWSDKLIYKYLKLSNDDIDLIENTKIKGFDKKVKQIKSIKKNAACGTQNDTKPKKKYSAKSAKK